MIEEKSNDLLLMILNYGHMFKNFTKAIKNTSTHSSKHCNKLTAVSYQPLRYKVTRQLPTVSRIAIVLLFPDDRYFIASSLKPFQFSN